MSARQTRLSRGCGACGQPGDHAPRFLTTRDFSELRCARAPAAQVFRLASPRADAGKQGSHCRVRVRPPQPLSARPSSPDCNVAGGFFASTALPTCSWKSPSAGRDSVLWMLRPFSRLLRWPRWSCLLSVATGTRVGHKPKPGDTSIERRCVGQRWVTTCPAGTAKEVPLLKDLGPTHCSKYFDVKLTGA